MNRYLGIIPLVIASLLIGCDGRIGDHLVASSISENGFARDAKEILEARGRKIKLWGFVDHGNIYGDVGAKKILGDWWSGDGPDAATRRFDLKAREDHEVGHSLAVHVPNDSGRDGLLTVLLADARAGIRQGCS
jgi:hypothetical protein